MRTLDREITVSQSIPTPLRVLLACLAVGLLLVLCVAGVVGAAWCG